MLPTLVVFLASFAQISLAGDKVVHDVAEAKAAIAGVGAGDTIVFADGAYDLGEVKIVARASGDMPIVIKAEHVGKTQLVGATGFKLERASYVTIEGFAFNPTDHQPLAVLGSDHVRITRNAFKVSETDTKKQLYWMIVQGTAGETDPQNSTRVRIDHNLFEEKHAPGNFIAVNGLGTDVATRVRIDHNHFRNIGPRIPNGMEAIRCGLSGLSLSKGFNVIEQNLFEECDGDPEVVSIKCCNTQVLNNTFVRCQGGVCLRHGNDNVVAGNVFFGEGKKGTDGIRAYGDDHRIYNNYLDGLTGTALNITGGNIDYGSGELENRKLLTGHFRPRHITLAFNTVIDCGQPIELGHKMNADPKLPPKDVTIANNLIVETKLKKGDKSPVLVPMMPEGLKLSGNIISMMTDDAPLGLDATPEQFKPVAIGELKFSRDDKTNVSAPASGNVALQSSRAKMFDWLHDDLFGHVRSDKTMAGAIDANSTKIRDEKSLRVGRSAADDVGPDANSGDDR